jgi:hypothetical protein
VHRLHRVAVAVDAAAQRRLRLGLGLRLTLHPQFKGGATIGASHSCGAGARMSLGPRWKPSY